MKKEQNLQEPQKQALNIPDVVRNLLLKYIDWERMWHTPTNKFKSGDKIKLNWKAWAAGYKQITPMTFKSIDSDNVVDTNEGDTWNLYWLCRS